MSAALAMAATLLAGSPAPVDVTVTADQIRPGHSGRVIFDLSAPAKTARNVIFEVDLTHLRQTRVTGISPACLSRNGIADCAYVKIPAGGHERVTVTLTALPQAHGQADSVTGTIVHGARETRRSVAVELAPMPVARKPKRPRVEATPTRPAAVREPVLAPAVIVDPPLVTQARPVERVTRPTWLFATVVPAFLLLGLVRAVRRRS